MVVYESMFGNTESVAKAIATGLGRWVFVETFEVTEAPTHTEGFDMVVVGGPTHQFGLSRTASRSDLAKKGPITSRGIGLRDWLAALEVRPRTKLAVAFTTVVDKPQWLQRVGTAVGPLERRLVRLGLRLAAPAARFSVQGMRGPLIDGELARAQRWGDRLAGAGEEGVKEVTGLAHPA